VSVLAHRIVGDPQPPRGRDWLRVAAIRLPRISNLPTDVEALACEPGVLVRWVTDPADLADADVIVVPGSKATVSDLGWLRERGLAGGITAHARQGTAGARHLWWVSDALCAHRRRGGIQGRPRRRPRPARRPTSRSRRSRPCGSTTPTCTATRSTTARLRAGGDDEWLDSSIPLGFRRGHVYGTHWHGLLDNDALRRQWLADAAAAAGRDGFVVADDVDVTGRRGRTARPDGRRADRACRRPMQWSACWSTARRTGPLSQRR